MKNELAIDADGQPFEVPTEVTGWRVRRVEGRGRPELAYDRMGRPLIVPVNATFPELYKAAGPGRYRLDPINATGHVCPDVPTGCTGPLQAPEVSPSYDGMEHRSEAPIGNTPVRPFGGYDDILCETIRANTRLAELVVSRFPSMMTSGAGLISAADGASITTRQPPPPPPALAPPTTTEVDDAMSESVMPSWIDTLIAQVVSGVVPMILAKLPGLFPGMPLGSLLDWSKAAPNAPPNPPAPSAPVPSVPTPSAPSTWPSTAPTSDVPPPSSVPAEPSMPRRATAPNVTAPTALSSHDGSDATGTSAEPASAGTDGTVTASSSTPPNTSTSLAVSPPAEPKANQDEGTALKLHLMQVWAGLSPAEQARAEQLVAALKPEERAQWVAELAAMSVPDATARVRSVLRPPTSRGQTGGRS